VPDKLLLITGAGASTELSSDENYPLPLMGDWAERLRAKLGPGLSAMSGLEEASDNGVKFEETLGALFTWLQSLDATERFTPMARQNESVQGDNWDGQFLQALNHCRQHGDRIQSLLNESLFEEFGPGRIDTSKAAAAYTRLFAALGFDSPVPGGLVCATTNYDRTLEMAFEDLGIVARTGAKPHGFKTPKLDPAGLGEFGDAPSLLYLHGAVGWYLQEDGTIDALPADSGYKAALGKPAVLYPSLNKDPDLNVTAAIWREFRTAVGAATHILVLGHALNDDHLLRELRATNARIAVTYLAAKPPTSKASDASAAEAEGHIEKRMPSAVPVAARFSGNPEFDKAAVARWRS
jgi:hypothetical protein